MTNEQRAAFAAAFGFGLRVRPVPAPVRPMTVAECEAVLAFGNGVRYGEGWQA